MKILSSEVTVSFQHLVAFRELKFPFSDESGSP